MINLNTTNFYFYFEMFTGKRFLSVLRLEGTMTQYRKLDLSSEEKDQKLQDLELR